MDESYESARRILSDHMDKLHAVAKVLMEKEKISGDDFRALMEHRPTADADDEEMPAQAPEAPAQDSTAQQPPVQE